MAAGVLLLASARFEDHTQERGDTQPALEVDPLYRIRAVSGGAVRPAPGSAGRAESGPRGPERCAVDGYARALEDLADCRRELVAGDRMARSGCIITLALCLAGCRSGPVQRTGAAQST